jgi:hypothetical protein
LDIDSLLTPEKKAQLKQEAEDKILAREIAAAEAEYLQKMTDELDRARHPEIVEEYREISLDLPPFMDRVVLDGRHYMHGGRYTVPKRVFDVMREVTWNAFKHDDEVNNRRNSNAYRQERELRMSSQTGNIVDNTGRPAVKF